MFSFTENLKINFFYSTSQIFRKYNHKTICLYNWGGGGGGLCLANGLSVFWFGFCLLFGFCAAGEAVL